VWLRAQHNNSFARGSSERVCHDALLIHRCRYRVATSTVRRLVLVIKVFSDETVESYLHCV
jgi:hypothetical protein